MMDYYDSMNPSTELVMTMKDCFFRDNRYFGNEAYSALIYGNSNQNRLIIEKTIFENNNMIWNNTKVRANVMILVLLYYFYRLHTANNNNNLPFFTKFCKQYISV
ncbi:MAG: hypothetical protein ACI90V_005131 [Bacillariaceae sp.]|jgi:hypothetical protein